MTIHMSKKWPEMVAEPDMCSQFYIETVYIYHSIKLPFDSEVAEKILNVI